jgi:hypothetical protein
MRVPEEPVCIHLFRQNPVFTSLHFKSPEAVRHEREISNTGGKNWIFSFLLGLLLAGNLVKPLLSLYGIEWREHGYGLRSCHTKGVGPSTTLARPGWKQPGIAVEVDIAQLETSRFKKCCANCVLLYYPSTEFKNAFNIY